jgi:hypothetical protein
MKHLFTLCLFLIFVIAFGQNQLIVWPCMGNQSICSGVSTAAPVCWNSNQPNTTTTWTLTANPNIVGAIVSGTGAIPAMTPTNTSNIPQNIVYSATSTANGQTVNNTYTITVMPIPVISANPNLTYCNGTQSALISFTGTGNSFSWTNSNTAIGLGASGNGNIAPFATTNPGVNAVSGIIAVTPIFFWNGLGCTGAPNNFSITVNPTPTVTNNTLTQSICSGANTSAVPWTSNLVGTTYAWTGVGSSPTVTGFTASGSGNLPAMTIINSSNSVQTVTYTVTPTTNGCSGPGITYTITVNDLPLVSAGQNQSVCAGTAGTLNGSGANTYTWNNGVSNGVAFTPAATQTYTVTGTNANGCSNTAQVTITVNALPTVSAGQNQAVCSGTAVTLSGSGANTYTWNNGVSNGVAFTPAATQTYTVTGTNANGCSNTAQVTVTVNALPTVSAGQNQAVCAGTAVTLSGSGASTYTWNNGVSNGVAFTPAATQTYTVTGTNANGCSNTAQVTVTVNALPTVSAGQNQVVCAGTAVTLNGSGANTYTWNNGVSNGVAFTPAATQTNTVTGTNANGCSNTAQVTITVNALPIVSAGNNQTVCNGSQVTLAASGAITYLWNNGIQNAVPFTPNATQTYIVTGTNANGCQNYDTVLVTVNNPSSSIIDSVACAPFLLNGQTYNQSGTYTQTIPNNQGCDSTITLNLTINDLPTIPTITVDSNNVLSISGQANYTYQWVFCSTGFAIAGEVDTLFTPTTNGVYAVQTTNDCGTSTSQCVTINNVSLSELGSVISVFPNPTFSEISVRSDHLSHEEYTIHDQMGRVVGSGFLEGSITIIDLGNLSKGIYILKIQGMNEPLALIKE